ncbi:hypothetical protein [Ruegeria sp. SCP11]|uniref:hypothetical protein n=1 Tax=Ruegeria sp. SCP11 TaxID=3141378 RepID=UPI00333C9AFA
MKVNGQSLRQIPYYLSARRQVKSFKFPHGWKSELQRAQRGWSNCIGAEVSVLVGKWTWRYRWYGYLRQSFVTRGSAPNPAMTGMLCSLLFSY